MFTPSHRGAKLIAMSSSDASSGRPLTPYEQWIQNREAEQQQQQQQRPISEGMVAAPTNFMRPDQRRSWTTPAGVSQFADVEDPSPDRITGEMRRQAYAEASREAERMTRLSGSATNRVSARDASKVGWEPHLVRDSSGRLRTDWSRIGSDLPHDAAGRPRPTTDVDRGFTPGQDFW